MVTGQTDKYSVGGGLYACIVEYNSKPIMLEDVDEGPH